MVLSQKEDNYYSSKKLCLILLITFRSFTNVVLGSCSRHKELEARYLLSQVQMEYGW